MAGVAEKAVKPNSTLGLGFRVMRVCVRACWAAEVSPANVKLTLGVKQIRSTDLLATVVDM
jgi:hypothetical protein